MRKFALLVAAVAASLTVVLSATAQQGAVKLRGVVGPGESISLTKSGKLVRSLKRGRYSITVSDRSSEHDFHLSGPGVNKIVTTVPGTGSRTITVALRRGVYRYVCDPHADSMRGSFRVS